MNERSRGIRPWRQLVSCLLVAALAGCGVEGRGAARGDARGPDIALIVIDTLRRDHLEPYGYDKPTAPWLTGLAERAVVFERAYSTSSWTAPATASVLTGLYPTRHGLVLGMNAAIAERNRLGAEHASMRLTRLPELETLPELLQGAGYQTFGLAANINVTAERGFDRGFEHFLLQPGATAEELGELVGEWRSKRERGRPAFWYLHFDDVHRPYHPREPWYEPQYDAVAENISRYDSEIRYLDGELERIAKTLRWDDDTVVIVLADHGEEFTDHGDFGHKDKLYAELVNVPLMVHAPALTGPARRVAVPVSLIDVLPTVAALAGLDLEGRDGRSWLPLLSSESEDDGDFPERALYAHRREAVGGKARWAVVSEGWKLILYDGSNAVELYSQRDDPTEQHDLAAERPELVAHLRERLAVFQATEALEAESVEIPLDPELRRRLEALGYAGSEDDDE